MSVARSSSSCGSGGSQVRCRSDWRIVPAWSEAWKLTSVPEPMISSVEPPPMSKTSVGSSAGRSAVAPR